MTAYNAVSQILSRAENLGVWLAIWEARREPDAHARRAASDAVGAIDAMFADLHEVRAQLIGEIRTSDDASAARADAMLHHPGREGA